MKTFLALCLSTLLFLSGCAGRFSPQDAPADQLYRLAQEAVQDHEFEHAQAYLDQIRDLHPFSAYAVEAELLAADMAYADDRFEEAAAAYRSFEELHPTHPKVPYAIFMRGQSYLDISLPADRDQTATRNAADAFQKLLYAHANTEYGEKARSHLEQVRSRLAAHELYVARYYLRKKRYEAALHRLQGMLQDYPDAPQQQEATLLVEQARIGAGQPAAD